MKIEKKYLDEMKRCYCASNISFDGENHVLFQLDALVLLQKQLPL